MDKPTHQGLTTQQAQELLAKYGKNTISSQDTYSILEAVFSQFVTVINGILAIGAVFSLLIGNYLDASFIFAIIILNALFGFFQEYKAEESMKRLKSYTAPTARVMRDGKETEIPAEELVVGDIVILSEGARVPADGKLVHTSNLEVDESILTGESLAVIKQISEDVFSGTLVNRGRGIVEVEKTGMNTRFGQIADTLASIEEDKTPLQKNFDHLGKTLSFSALLIGLMVIPVGLFHHVATIPLVLVAISIAIAAIPEGLPAAITIAFAIGTHRMAKRHAIVRKMAAVETLGAIQVILVDKTGTITQNSMTVKKHWLMEKDSLPHLLKACVLGNTASLIEKGDNDFEVVGDQTDGALLLFAKKENYNLSKEGKIIDEFVFDNDTNTITTLWKEGNKEYVFVRGAPESVLTKSTLSEKEKNKVTKEFEAFAKEGLRAVAFAMRSEKHLEQKNRVKAEQDLTFLGLVGLYDPPRPEIKDAIEKARSAGIHVSMVTGDNELTALSLAKEIGLIEEDEDVVTGEELEKLSDEELSSIILQTRIFARTRPEQKLRLVTLLKEQGLVVGVTGDGVNDALALKKADVGVAMGKGGTDVAKEASDIVLSDNNFASLVRAIEEGRLIYKNIVNAVIYLISGNLAEISLVFFAVLLQLPFPLLPTQILWINLITDGLPALALATGNRDATVLLKKPRDPKMPLLNRNRILVILLIGFSLSGFLIITFSFLLTFNSEAVARTVVFNLLIFFHLLLVLVLGRHSLKRGNVFIILTISITLILQLLITSLPFFQKLFHLAV